MSTYILLKDLPNIKAGMRFIPNGCGEYEAEDKSDMCRDRTVENTPEWFEKEEYDFSELEEKEKIFNAAREKKLIPCGRIERNDGDCGDYYDYKYKSFIHYLKCTRG